jgi:hypothetical protein
MATSGPSTTSLDDLYLFQNAKTGDVSVSAVTVRQLCKILSTGTTHVTRETNVWKTPSADSWEPLKEIPVLREASAHWYFNTGDQQSQGPVGVKQLRLKIREENLSPESTMVWSPQLPDLGWVPLSDSPYLLLAIEAFELTPSPKTEEDTLPESTDPPEGGEQVEEAPGDVQRELEAFLNSTGATSLSQQMADKEDEEYVSDGGTTYIKDHSSGKWIHEALVPKPPDASSQNGNKKRPSSKEEQNEKNHDGKKRKRSNKFSARNAKCWVYVTGLPLDTDEEEVSQVFSKVGILDLDSDTQKPKVKLYYTEDPANGARSLKGDASICFARPESVELALQLLDEAPFRLEDSSRVIRVEHAKFEQQGQSYQVRPQSWKKRQVAKTAALQAVGWDEDTNGRITGGKKGLTIIVLRNMYTMEQTSDGEFLKALEAKLLAECSNWGTVEKITMFSSNPEGILLIRFKEPVAATTAIHELNGRVQGDKKIEAHFWDGVTDYAVKNIDKEKEIEEERHQEFGQWLESTQDDLPEELRLKVES